MQPCNRIYYSSVHWRLNMFRAAYRSSSGAQNCICNLWFTYTCGDRPLSRLSGKFFRTQPWQRPVTTCVCKPEAANTVLSSWWWAVCRSKHVEPSINVGIINYITRLHLVSYFYWYILRCTDPWISKVRVNLQLCTLKGSWLGSQVTVWSEVMYSFFLCLGWFKANGSRNVTCFAVA